MVNVRGSPFYRNRQRRSNWIRIGDAGSRSSDGVVPPQPRAVAGALRPPLRKRVLRAADRLAPSDRLLRRAPAGVQLQYAGEKGAGPAEYRRAARSAVRTWDRSGRVVGEWRCG